jgi:hypothetical protein
MTIETLQAPSTALDFLFGADGVASLARQLDARRVLQESPIGVKSSARRLWSAAHRELANVTAEFLDVDLGGLAVAGWRKHRELLDAAERTRGRPVTALVPLGGHDICVDQHPRVEVEWGSVTVTVVRFELRMVIKALRVLGHVRDGHLVALAGGPCEVTGSFATAGVVLAQRTARFDPALVVALGKGIPLPGATQSAAAESGSAA